MVVKPANSDENEIKEIPLFLPDEENILEPSPEPAAMVSIVQKILQKDEGIFDLDQYSKDCIKNKSIDKLEVALDTCKTLVLEALERNLSKKNTVFSLVGPKIEAIMQLFDVYVPMNKTDVLCDFLENKSRPFNLEVQQIDLFQNSTANSKL